MGGPLRFQKTADPELDTDSAMWTSENVRIYVVFGYIRNFYRYIDLIARCAMINDVFDDILSHSTDGEMFT